MAHGCRVRCKSEVDIRNARNVTLKNQRPAVKGVCIAPELRVQSWRLYSR